MFLNLFFIAACCARNNAKLIDFFTNPKSVRQKQYEVVRAFVVDKSPKVTIADKFNYNGSSAEKSPQNARKVYRQRASAISGEDSVAKNNM